MKLFMPISFVVILLVTLLSPRDAFAHSALVSTTPDTTSDTEVSELTLTFNEAIEPASSVKVTNEANEEQTVNGTTVSGRTMTVALEQPLQNGVFKVEWRIISKDGHPAKGSYSFEVRIPETSPSPAPTSSESDVSAAETAPSASASPTLPVQEGAGQSGSDDSSGFDLSKGLLYGAAGLLAVAVVVSLFKKRKS